LLGGAYKKYRRNNKKCVSLQRKKKLWFFVQKFEYQNESAMKIGVQTVGKAFSATPEIKRGVFRYDKK
jgi:hypothetical protein